MKTTMPDGTVHEFRLRGATGFVGGETIEIDASDVTDILKMLRVNPVRLAASLEQLRGRFPSERVGSSRELQEAESTCSTERLCVRCDSNQVVVVDKPGWSEHYKCLASDCGFTWNT